MVLEGPPGDLCEHTGEDEHRRNQQLRVKLTREEDTDSHKRSLARHFEPEPVVARGQVSSVHEGHLRLEGALSLAHDGGDVGAREVPVDEVAEEDEEGEEGNAEHPEDEHGHGNGDEDEPVSLRVAGSFMSVWR